MLSASLSHGTTFEAQMAEKYTKHYSSNTIDAQLESICTYFKEEPYNNLWCTSQTYPGIFRVLNRI